MQKFSKYHGAGNDFILIDARGGDFDSDRDLIAALCDRRWGIGADGLMMLELDTEADFRMRYFNADGGEATLCGNGGRCIVLFAHHLGIGERQKRFRAADGFHAASILSSDGDEATIALNMMDVLQVERHGEAWSLDTGSPHYVEFVAELDAVDVRVEGARIRHDARFVIGGGTNVNFVELVADGHIRVRTFERGVESETLACGTGAVASALATFLRTKSARYDFRVEMPGGELRVQFTPTEAGGFTCILLTGPAQKVFEGTVDLENFKKKSSRCAQIREI